MADKVTAQSGKSIKRRYKNYLLQPSLQIKFGIYSTLAALLFVASLAGVLYFYLAQLYSIVLELTEVPEEILFRVIASLKAAFLPVLLIVVGFISINIWVSIRWTHKMVGPTVAFRRQLQAIMRGNFKSRIKLRQNDAFAEVAVDLNRLTQMLEMAFGAAEQSEKKETSSASASSETQSAA